MLSPVVIELPVRIAVVEQDDFALTAGHQPLGSETGLSAGSVRCRSDAFTSRFARWDRSAAVTDVAHDARG
jgi:hypothetical protein